MVELDDALREALQAELVALARELEGETDADAREEIESDVVEVKAELSALGVTAE